MQIGKIFFHQARPYWVSDNIHAYSCSTQYGNPSGHSLSGLGVTLTVWLDFNEVIITNSANRNQNETFWAHRLVRMFFFTLAIGFGISIGYSRVVLGAHSWNQLALGWQLGVWLALTMHFIFRNSLLENVQQLLENR